MALSGYAERDNRHALTCFKVVSKSQASKYFWRMIIFHLGLDELFLHNIFIMTCVVILYCSFLRFYRRSRIPL